MTTPMMVT